MHGVSIASYAQLACAKTSMDLFCDLRALLAGQGPITQKEAAALAIAGNTGAAEEQLLADYVAAMELIQRVALLAGMLEGRGVLADVEQYLTGLYENTRRPGYAGTTAPLERAARDAAEGVQL